MLCFQLDLAGTLRIFLHDGHLALYHHTSQLYRESPTSGASVMSVFDPFWTFALYVGNGQKGPGRLRSCPMSKGTLGLIKRRAFVATASASIAAPALSARKRPEGRIEALPKPDRGKEVRTFAVSF